MEKSYRIHTTNGDTLVNVNMQQDFDFLEILSLKLGKKDSYRLHSSNYGVIAGRVLANDAFGIPNAKISLFIERDTTDPNEMRDIYPYSEVTSRDRNSIRYNLLPDYSDDECYRVVGTFPRKRYLLDDNIQLDIYDKYWKYTTVTNNSGDYMLFGVPAGGQQIHVDIDLSDIGVLSQKPRDFIFKGHNVEEFDSPSQFKESTNLDSLQQIISQNKTTVVYPFWGDADNGIAAITRCDIQVNYKFEPTCVFMGSIVSDNEGNAIGHKCNPSEENGLNTQLVAGEGTIEMIRKTTDGLVEEFPINGNALIDSDGVWCYQIPMNLDYVGTDEYGNIVPTDDPSRGIPTRTQVRFRFSKRETGDEGTSNHTAKYLVPMNPEFDENQAEPFTQARTGQEIEKMYNFGSNTPLNCFRDLYWNNVYSVKNFIPKVQVAHRAYAPTFGGLKGANLVDNQNPIPFNKLRIDLPFMYMIVCIIYEMIIWIVSLLNSIIGVVNWLIEAVKTLAEEVSSGPFDFLGDILSILPGIGGALSDLFHGIGDVVGGIVGGIVSWVTPDCIKCIPLSAGLSEGNIAYYPGCGGCGYDEASCPSDMEGECEKSTDSDELLDKIQRNLALDFKIINLDFYQDWINGCLYMPLWYWRKRKKKSYLFGLITRSAKNEYCNCDKDEYSRLKTYVTCNMAYDSNSLGYKFGDDDDEEDRWHRNRKQWVRYSNGLIKPVVNKDGLTAYYYVGYQPDNRDNSSMPILQRNEQFRFVRLYATDIILLGNLNEDNIYGIPQLFKALPSTSANIPPIVTFKESNDKEILSDNGYQNEAVGDKYDSGDTVVTGMDWGSNGENEIPKYRNGLFMDLTCTIASTAAKSCINVERLSELSTNLDMTFNMSYSVNGANDIRRGKIDADGMVNKFELDEMDNRAAFATLNHIGFVPQDYQDTLGGTATTTQVIDERTGYLIPKFKYIYPVEFDGRFNEIMKKYKINVQADDSYEFNQAMYDEADESYITFRLGAENEEDANNNLERRLRHFYYAAGDEFEMPLYNNSYYFYFGINKGNTAIEKFNKLFYSPCAKRDKKPFTMDIISLGRSYCPAMYGEPETGYNGYGYIRVTCDDIAIPFSYSLRDNANNIVVEEDGMVITDFVIGGTINEGGQMVMNPNGEVKYQDSGNIVESYYGENGLTNQVYTLEITDVFGKRLTERIELKVPTISVNVETENLKTKFYDTDTTRMDYICNDNTEFYGKIKVESFNVDEYLFYITGTTDQKYSTDTNEYIFTVNGIHYEFNVDREGHYTPIEGTEKEASAVIRVSAMSMPTSGLTTRDCMCDMDNSITSKTYSHIDSALVYTQYWFGVEDADEDEKVIEGQIVPTMYVYQPNRFMVTIRQYCEDREIADNMSSEIVAVGNGNNFNAFLNGMPVKFMLGTVSDSSAATIANNSMFYRSNPRVPETQPATHESVKGWYGLHQEDSYRWFDMEENKVRKRNKNIWADFVKLHGDITTVPVKADILVYKLTSMFSLAREAYIAKGNGRFSYRVVGGISPILYRAVVPNYSSKAYLREGYYILGEGNYTSCPAAYPNIVGKNYRYSEDGESEHDREYVDGPNFNMFYNKWDVIGNYFAAFTNNGGYTSKTRVDPNENVVSIPNFAKVTPWKLSNDKALGQNDTGVINDRYEPAYQKYGNYQPYLRALTVDRRLDYDLMLIAPCYSKMTRLYSSANSGREKIWRSARISGTTYNGIEMSYDGERNIISADTGFNDEGVVTSATYNNRLEYSYHYSDDDEDANTRYNIPSSCVWERDGNSTQQINKRFYEANFTGEDIRNYFWSTFNKDRLSRYTSGLSLENNYNYVYKYPANASSFYNGDFNRDNVFDNKNYPTRRYIDIGNISGENSTFSLSILNCSYATTPVKDTNNVISCKAKSNGGLTWETTFSEPITFISKNADSKNGYNVLYQRNNEESGYARFTLNFVDFAFSINPIESNGFNVYTAAPKIIKVLPYTDGYDGISCIKGCIPSGNDGTITDDIDKILYKMEGLRFYKDIVQWHLMDTGSSIFTHSATVPAGVRAEYKLPWETASDPDAVFFYNEKNLPLTNNSAEFQGITFNVPNIDVINSETQVFCVLIERRHVSKKEDGLTKKLKTLEFSELYDTRKLLIKVNQNETFIKKIQNGAGYAETDITALTGTVTGETVSGGEIDNASITEGGGKTTGNTSGYSHIQTITFDMPVNYADDPTKSTCEAFLDYNSMSYTFIFQNAWDEIFELTPVVSAGTDNIIHFIVRWPQDMGVMADEGWRDDTRCSVIAKTRSNFIYRIPEFKLTWCGDRCQEGDYDSDKKTSTLDINGTGKTFTQIVGL